MAISFYIPHRQKNEFIILLLRRHWFIITLKFLFWAVVALMPALLYIMLQQIFPSLFVSYTAEVIIVLFLSAYYLFVWLFAFNTFVDYYLDVWVVTNERIINMEQNGLFSRTVAEQNLHRVQDVTSEMKGMVPTFLNYGTVYIQTAGEQQRFIFKEISDPAGVARKISKLVEHKKHEHEVEIKQVEQ